MSSASASNMDESEIPSFGEELRGKNLKKRKCNSIDLYFIYSKGTLMIRIKKGKRYCANANETGGQMNKTHYTRYLTNVSSFSLRREKTGNGKYQGMKIVENEVVGVFTRENG